MDQEKKIEVLFKKLNDAIKETEKLKNESENFQLIFEDINVKIEILNKNLEKSEMDKIELFEMIKKNDYELIDKELRFKSCSKKLCGELSELKDSAAKNSISLRFDSLIPINHQVLIKNLDSEAFKSFHSAEWLCFALFDLFKKNVLHSSAINEILEILIKIIKICDEKSLDLVEKMLNEVNNFDLVAKYELFRQVIMCDPNRKRKMLIIFIRDLEKLVKSTSGDELDQNFKQNNSELFQRIKLILEMSNFSVYDIIDIDTINSLKRRWCVSNSRPILRPSSLISQ